ncbi:Cytochrome C and Quinol oxidase polypeptide I [Pedobacter steynii]|uniref:Cytochrome C and Quinol oxidase polypeptide I n=1 Tax=Pedobacter steynii TaxID=430522 RepID=A0A1G9RJB5_9SPHI|nr:hypothetical protein [Pedobacter steynii]NQX37738.1 hypothetical protein [Pedobacter steynii]SDM23251.1 Cytochrome C and Quinol oxidase polypeptide I [Pedobacter steynii]
MKYAPIKLTPALLFLSTAILSLLIGFWTKKQTIDVNIYDMYYVIGHLGIAVLICLFTGLTGLIYLALERIKRPVKLKMGYWHFWFFMAGLLILVPAFGLKILTDSPYTAPIFVLASILLFFISLVIFVIGLARAFFYAK